MNILSIKVMRGPNYWSTYRKQLIVLKLDLEDDEDIPTDKIEGFAERLEQLMPTLFHHRCSEKEKGGFLHRVKKGTSLGHVIEHVALELQSIAGMPCSFGSTRPSGQKGIYHILFSYQLANAGKYAAVAAVNIVRSLKNNLACTLPEDISALKKINRTEGLGPTTQSILNAAKKRKIPFRRLSNNSMILLGQGANQKVFQASITSATSSIGVDTASNKQETKRILSEAYIPVPDGKLVYYPDEFNEAIKRMGFPLVVKPVNGNQGKGITTDIRSEEQALKAFEKAKAISSGIIIEKFIKGMDYRFLVINYRLEAVAKRTPAMIRGDEDSTIQQLIDKVNADPNRGDGHEKILTKIKVDEELLSTLKEKGLSLHSVLPAGEILLLKDTANLSTGGTARDTTEMVHPYNVFMAERIARLSGLDICGIDMVAQDISKPITIDTGAVIEVNAAPGFRMHLSPTTGIARNVGEPVINMLYPDGAPSRIPIVAVTGTNGKTTTTRLIAYMARQAGHSVGYTTTDGIYIQDQVVHYGDCSGPTSAETVLRDPVVDFAVLECARGGILRAGLGFDKCNISIITNITEDHIGLDDINTIEELAKVKSVVVRSTFENGFAILNADDELVYGLKDELECNIALFSTHENNERIISHCEDGGWAAIIEKGYFTICQGEWKIRLAKVNEVPLTIDGKAMCMIKNILPAVLAASLSDFDVRIVRKALQTFIPGPNHTPGRMNIFTFKNFKVMIDYVHNTDGFEQMQEFMKNIQAENRVGIIGCAGDRRDSDIINMGSSAARMFDDIIIRHDKDGRGRSNDELTRLINEGIQAVRPEAKTMIISDEQEALAYAMDNAVNGTFIVVSSDDIRNSIEFVTSRQKQDAPEMVPEM